MKIAVIGAGQVGGTLGRRWSEAGHEVVFGVRHPGSARLADLLARCGPDARALDPAAAAATCQVVVLAVWWSAVPQLLARLGDLSGKILVDCTNPLDEDLRLVHGHHESGGEMIADWAPGTRVVKAFNTVLWETMANPDYGPRRAVVFYCGGDDAARETVAGLIEDLGLEPHWVGGIEMSRYLEPLAALWVSEFRLRRPGSDYAFALLKRRDEEAPA